MFGSTYIQFNEIFPASTRHKAAIFVKLTNKALPYVEVLSETHLYQQIDM